MNMILIAKKFWNSLKYVRLKFFDSSLILSRSAPAFIVVIQLLPMKFPWHAWIWRDRLMMEAYVGMSMHINLGYAETE